MKAPGKLCSLHPVWGGGLVALDVNGCAWWKPSDRDNWQRIETPAEQHERLLPGHLKRKGKK